MLEQPDRDQFIEAMNNEVSAIFEEKIWELVPKQEMIDHYSKEREKGIRIKREQLSMI